MNVTGLTTKVFHGLNDAYQSGKFDVFVLEGGSRSSKTFSIIQFWIAYAAANNGKQKRVLVSRKKGTWITTTVLQDFVNALKSYGLYNFAKHNKSTGSGIITLYTTEFWFLGLDDEQKIHGLETDAFWINEAVEASFEDYSQLMQRCKGFAVLDYNPSYDEHWIYDKILKRETSYYGHSTMLDNDMISANAKKQILSYEPTEYNYEMGTVDKRKWEIYGLGKRSSIEGLVFSNGFTVVKSIPDFGYIKRYGGIDFGFSNDVTAIVDVGIDRGNNAIYIDELCYKTEMLTSDIIRELKDKFTKSMQIISESADPRLVQEIYNAGINIHAVKKYQGSIVAGVDKIKTMKVYITERSENAQKEWRNYTYKQDKAGKFLNDPQDSWNHCADAVRYIVLEILLGKGQPQNLYNILGQFA